MMELYVWILTSIIAFAYTATIIIYTSGWFKLKHKNYKMPDILPEVSVILPFYNEQKGIAESLKSLLNQNYPKDKFEIILVNDYSSDNSTEIIKNIIKDFPENNVKLIEKTSEKFGKKAAIQLGIQKAYSELIITTDADCAMGAEWIASIAKTYAKHSPDLILGPVLIKPEKGLFSKIQSLEFFSLIGITGGSAYFGAPIMANGANLAFKKSCYLESTSYDIGDKFESGDDMFLLQKVKKQKGKKILFLKDYNATVATRPQNSLVGFLKQRTRWAGKTKGYKDAAAMAVAIIVFLMSAIILASGFMLILGKNYFLFPFVSASILKLIVDFPILAMVSRFFKLTNLLYLYPLVFVFYPFYIIGTAFISLIYKPSWKSRT